jgi:hypothetical protein
MIPAPNGVLDSAMDDASIPLPLRFDTLYAYGFSGLIRSNIFGYGLGIDISIIFFHDLGAWGGLFVLGFLLSFHFLCMELVVSFLLGFPTQKLPPL